MIPARQLSEYTKKSSILEEINCAILHKSFEGGNKITRFINGNIPIIKEYYENIGYTVTSDPITPLLITISWPTR